MKNVIKNPVTTIAGFISLIISVLMIFRLVSAEQGAQLLELIPTLMLLLAGGGLIAAKDEVGGL